jgi:hypothetical protein
MAHLQKGNIHGLPAIAGQDINGGDDDGAGFADADMLTIDAMRARLGTIDAGYYTTAMLDIMTANDMVYALRVHDSLSTVN